MTFFILPKEEIILEENSPSKTYDSSKIHDIHESSFIAVVAPEEK